MRDHLEIIEEISKVLDDKGLEDERKQLDHEVMISVTGSELCLRTCSKLLYLQNRNKQVSISCGYLINELVSYCHANGLYPKPRLED